MRTVLAIVVLLAAGLALAAGWRAYAYPPPHKLDAALLNACRRGDTGRIVALLKRGADANARDAHGTSALMLVLQSTRYTGIHVVGKLATKDNADGTVSSGVFATYDRSVGPAAHDTRAVKALLAHGAKVNARNEWGTTPAMLAAGQKTTDCIELLLAHGADIHAKQLDGADVMEWAAGHGNAAMFRLLLKHGLSPNVARADDGVTPLMLEVWEGTAESVKALLDAGAHVNARAKEGGTALTYARAAGNTAVVKALLAAGARE